MHRLHGINMMRHAKAMKQRNLSKQPAEMTWKCSFRFIGTIFVIFQVGSSQISDPIITFMSRNHNDPGKHIKLRSWLILGYFFIPFVMGRVLLV